MDLYEFPKHSPWIKEDLEMWRPVIKKPAIFYKKHEIIYNQGDPATHVYIIESGRVQIRTVLPNGMEKQIYIGDTGSLCGEVSCIRKQEYSGSARAEADCYIYRVLFEDLYEEMKRNWTVAEGVLLSVSKKADVLHRQVVDLSFSSSMYRTVQTLIFLMNDYGVKTGSGIKVQFKFTHEDIAGLINSSRATVSYTLSDLSSKGIIEKKGGYYTILKPEELILLAKESDPKSLE